MRLLRVARRHRPQQAQRIEITDRLTKTRPVGNRPQSGDALGDALFHRRISRCRTIMGVELKQDAKLILLSHILSGKQTDKKSLFRRREHPSAGACLKKRFHKGNEPPRLAIRMPCQSLLVSLRHAQFFFLVDVFMARILTNHGVIVERQYLWTLFNGQTGMPLQQRIRTVTRERGSGGGETGTVRIFQSAVHALLPNNRLCRSSVATGISSQLVTLYWRGTGHGAGGVYTYEATCTAFWIVQSVSVSPSDADDLSGQCWSFAWQVNARARSSRAEVSLIAGNLPASQSECKRKGLFSAVRAFRSIGYRFLPYRKVAGLIPGSPADLSWNTQTTNKLTDGSRNAYISFAQTQRIDPGPLRARRPASSG